DTFDLPDGSVRLASSINYPNQAFRIGKKIYALQFHIEVTESMIKEWFDVNDEEVKELKGKINPAKILNETDVKVHELKKTAKNFFNAFLNIL
ncbi:MAG: GMP synthase, partial [Nitrospirota bacterium]